MTAKLTPILNSDSRNDVARQLTEHNLIDLAL